MGFRVSRASLRNKPAPSQWFNTELVYSSLYRTVQCELMAGGGGGAEEGSAPHSRAGTQAPSNMWRPSVPAHTHS